MKAGTEFARGISMAARAVLRAHPGEFSGPEVAAACGVSDQSVRQMAARKGLELRITGPGPQPGRTIAQARTDRQRAVARLAALIEAEMRKNPERERRTDRSRKAATRAPSARRASVLAEAPGLTRAMLDLNRARPAR